MNWKERRMTSYLIHQFDDVNLPHAIVYESKQGLIDRIVRFFHDGSELVYPAKSYFVAIIYAHYLHEYFSEDFYQMLSDPELLPDDEYFIPYNNESKSIYDAVLEQVQPIDRFISIEKTHAYFLQEFLLEEEYGINH